MQKIGQTGNGMESLLLVFIFVFFFSFFISRFRLFLSDLDLRSEKTNLIPFLDLVFFVHKNIVFIVRLLGVLYVFRDQANKRMCVRVSHLVSAFQRFTSACMRATLSEWSGIFFCFNLRTFFYGQTTHGAYLDREICRNNSLFCDVIHACFHIFHRCVRHR